jgi:class 3 adenylate cyclase
MEREMREIREEFSKKSMRLTTTLMRIKNLTKSLDRDQIFSNIVEIIAKGLDADKVQLLLNDEKEGKFRVVKANNLKPKEYKDIVVSHEENSMITYLLRQKMNEVTGGAGALGVKECEMDPKTKGLIGQGTLKTLICAPIYAEGKLFAVINVESMRNPDYTRDDQNLLATCGDISGLVMKNAKLYSATMDDLVSAQKLSEDQLQKNEQLKGSLSRIVSPSVADMIMSDPSGLKLGGSKCEVTIFFSDIRGFTKMSENMDPTDVVEQLNVYFTRMTDILMDLDGTLDKYVGDELMALFGAPVSREDDPVRAVLCGVKMLEALKELQEVWKKENKPVITIGIGINTGEVTAGYMGSEKQLSYTVIGDNVNLGARVMAVAKGMQMFITRSTYERVKDYFIIEQKESIMVKGKSMPIEIFEVMGMNPEADFSDLLKHGAGTLAGGASANGNGSADSQPAPVRKEEPLDDESKKQNIQIDDKPKVIECQNCGTENDMQEKFCVKCGMPIF